MLFKRFSVLICPILLFLILEIIFYFYNIVLILIALPVCLLLLVFVLKLLIKEKIATRTFFYLSFPPVLFFCANFGLLFLTGPGFLKHIVILSFALILAVYLENTYLFFYRPLHYPPYALENLAGLFNLLIFFYWIVNLNALHVFLNLPLWLLSLVLIAVLSLILGQFFWINKIKQKIRFAYLLIINIIILEFFWVLAFLPANFYVGAIILTIVFYFLWGVFKLKLIGQLNRKSFLRYLAIASALLFVIIFTSAWI